MRLPEIQDEFKSTLLRPLTEMEDIDQNFSTLFNEGHIPITERLKVYHGNVIGSISKNLAGNFPLLEKLVGEDFLTLLCRQFTIQNPPTTGCLNNYGTRFDRFIAAHPQTVTMPYLADVARWELAIMISTNAKDDVAISQHSLSLIPQDQLADTILELRNSCQLIKSEYPLMALREFCLNPDLPAPDLSGSSQSYTLIFRPNLEIVLVPMDLDEYMFLENILAGNTLGQSLSQAIEYNEYFNISAAMQKHLLLGTFKTL